MPAQSAAIVNAYQIHCLEFDCVHEGAVLHPMATILSPSLLGPKRARGDGIKVNGRIWLPRSRSVSMSPPCSASSPIRRSSILPARPAGGLGAAAAIAKLSGLRTRPDGRARRAIFPDQRHAAAHVEARPCSGLQVGFNARAAIVATDLARAGFRGPHDILTGQYGYLVLYENND